MSPARAGTSAVVAVLGAAVLLLVLLTWASSIGPERVVSGGHVDRIRADEPSFLTATADADSEDPLEEARKEASAEPPGWVGALAFVLELLTVAVVAFLAFGLIRKLRQLWKYRTRRTRSPPEEVAFEVLGTPAHLSEVLEEDAAGQRAELAEEG